MPLSDTPLVSVCIPTYCGEAHLAETIDSVLRQSYVNFELWIVDDNSPDTTEEIVASYDDPRIRYVRNAKNLGPEGNWNYCLTLPKGKYFKLLPHDDLIESNCLKEQVSILEADDELKIALVFGTRRIIDPKGRTIMARSLLHPGPMRLDGRSLVRQCVRSGTNLIGEPGNALLRREQVNRIGIYQGRYPYVIDLDFWCRVLLHGDAFFTATPASSFRVSKGSWSVAIGLAQYSDFREFVTRLSDSGQFEISRGDLLIGLLKARLLSFGRLAFYRLRRW